MTPDIMVIAEEIAAASKALNSANAISFHQFCVCLSAYSSFTNSATFWMLQGKLEAAVF